MIPVRIDNADEMACAVDRTCGDRACGCDAPASAHAKGDTDASTPRRGLAAGLLALACAAGCLAMPLAVGGLAAASGAVAGVWWLVVGVLVVVAAALPVVRRRRGGRIC